MVLSEKDILRELCSFMAESKKKSNNTPSAKDLAAFLAKSFTIYRGKWATPINLTTWDRDEIIEHIEEAYSDEGPPTDEFINTVISLYEDRVNISLGDVVEDALENMDRDDAFEEQPDSDEDW
jgi:hypothetical protein